MSHFPVLAKLLKNRHRRNAWFALLLISAMMISLVSAPRLLEHSSVIYSQDISLLTSLPSHRDRLDYLLIAEPFSESPRYVIKYKNQTRLIAVKVPAMTHLSLERDVLLKHGIPYAIAQADWLALHEDVLHRSISGCRTKLSAMSCSTGS